MDGTRGPGLPDTIFALQAHAVRRRRDLGDQLADATDGPAVAGKVRHAMTLAELLPQTIVVRHQATSFGRRERFEWNPVRGHTPGPLIMLATAMPDRARSPVAITAGTGRQPRCAAIGGVAPGVRIQTRVYGLKNLAT